MVNEHGNSMPELNWDKFNPFDHLQQGQSFLPGLASGMPELMHGYEPAGIDEAMVDGHLRPEWRPVIGHLNRLGVAGLTQRRDQALRLVRDNGVTYTAHNEHSQDRPWSLDIVPHVIGAEEWRGLARAVAQRARLQDALIVMASSACCAKAWFRLQPFLVIRNSCDPCMALR